MQGGDAGPRPGAAGERDVTSDLGLVGDAIALLPGMVALRRAIHQEPEIGLDTRQTAAKVRAGLGGLPLEWREGDSTSGLVAILRGGKAGRTVLLRGDMDALPVREETGLPYSSRIDGVMHACGHDSHTAMLAGAAQLLCARREALRGEVMFMFQPGEEGWNGARLMLEDGLVAPLPDAAFALHVLPNAPHGVFAGRPGPLFASADTIEIIVTGRGGHASMPHDALDPVPVACEIVTAIQTFITRQVPVFDPAVVTIARIEAGTTSNVIPETATLIGTLRTVSGQARREVQEGLGRLAVGIAAAHGARAEFVLQPGFPVTSCDPRAVTLGQTAIRELFGAEAWRSMDHPIMGAEDFALVLEQVPGAMFLLGAAHEGEDWHQCSGLHSGNMVIDETVMARGAAALAGLAARFLKDGLDRPRSPESIEPAVRPSRPPTPATE